MSAAWSACHQITRRVDTVLSLASGGDHRLELAEASRNHSGVVPVGDVLKSIGAWPLSIKRSKLMLCDARPDSES